MAATLALVFRTRLRLLPLALALAAAALHLRRAVARGRQPDDGLDRGAAGADRPGGGLRDPVPGALRRAAARARTTRARGRGRGRAPAARRSSRPGVATAVGFLVLLLSPVPMVRGFGALLVLGIGLALACALCAGFAALVRFGRPAPAGRALPRARARLAASRHTRAWWTLASGSPTAPGAPSAWRFAAAARARDRRSPWPWSAWRRTRRAEVISDVRELVPQDLQALRDVNALQHETGVSGEIDVTVRARRHHGRRR